MNSHVASYPIPERINLLITVGILPLNAVLLWLGSHGPWYASLLAAWAFALTHNTPFSLMHEAVHGVASPNRRRNEWFGTFIAADFPTSFTLQRIAHLGHHKRNRTDQELYDYYLPHQSKTLRDFWLYAGNLFGLYWFLIPISGLLYLLAPWIYTSSRFIHGPGRFLGFEPYLEEIAQYSGWRIWGECLWALAYQIGLWWLLDLNWQGWLLCYWAFALHWSALQYVDHAWSPRDVINGAWNLRVHPLSQALALNYHYHLAHHRHPKAPWNMLPGLVDPAEPRPGFWSIYFSLWGGTRPAPPMEN